MRKGLDVFFPVLPVKRSHIESVGPWKIQTAKIDAVIAGMRTRTIEWLHAANSAERVLRNPGIEAVSRQFLATLEQLKIVVLDRNV
ncbi:hypothetical protein WL86_27345 [Burkholderia diffusa]|nr:hypothetical protein WL86_27345 [Burkholderia diffusa]